MPTLDELAHRLHLTPHQLPWLLVALLGALFLICALGWYRARRRIARANRGRQKLAKRAERRAEKLLRRKGYGVVERQPTRRWRMTIAGRPREVSSRADLLVERKGRRFVADVKTGGRAPDPRIPATRRQLMEYLLVFEVDGALLVDMERGRVREVEFPDFGPLAPP